MGSEVRTESAVLVKRTGSASGRSGIGREPQGLAVAPAQLPIRDQ
jgi:hypothetical protein